MTALIMLHYAHLCSSFLGYCREENRRGALGAGDPVAPAAADGSGLSGEARQAQIDAEWDEIARKNREIRYVTRCPTPEPPKPFH